MGLKPWEYIRLSEYDYYLLCIGQKDIDQKALQHLRKLCWITLCGYADPATRPANEQAWWPLDNDPAYVPINKKKVIKLHNKIMSLVFNNGK